MKRQEALGTVPSDLEEGSGVYHQKGHSLWEGLGSQSFSRDLECARVTLYGVGESLDEPGVSLPATAQQIKIWFCTARKPKGRRQRWNPECHRKRSSWKTRSTQLVSSSTQIDAVIPPLRVLQRFPSLLLSCSSYGPRVLVQILLSRFPCCD